MSYIPSPQRLQNARAILLAVRAELLAADPDLIDDARLMMDCLDSEGGESLDILRLMVRAFRETEAKAAGAKAEADEYAGPLHARSKRLATRAERIRAALLKTFEAIRLPGKPWEDAAFTLSTTKTPAKAIITDETLIPAEFKHTEMVTRIDTTAALVALQAGKKVPGFALVPSGARLVIRDR